MQAVIANLRRNYLIDAIKEFRSLYDCGLKEARDAVEAIRELLPRQGDESFVVISRFDEFDTDYTMTVRSTKDAAMNMANSFVKDRHETVVARVIAASKTVTTRTMQEVA
jgi:hypothetical protein